MDLTRIGATALYLPPAGARFVFLLWNPAGAPATIPFPDTWADQGHPAFVGWHVLVDATPGAKDAPALESDLRGALATDRGLAWVTPATGSTPFALCGAVPIGLDDAGRPAVSATSPIGLPKGMLQLGVAAALRVTALTDAGDQLLGGQDPAALGFADPAGQPALGLVVALTGPTSGCLSFSAFLGSPATPSRSVKPLAAVQIDPLAPYAPDRTRVTPLGRAYVVVSQAGGGYRLEEASA
jgi:hypothetical protein